MKRQTRRRQRIIEQYNDAEVLNDRYRLYREYSDINRFHWLFDHLDLSDQSRILDVGCGNGLLWRENQNRIPNSCRLTMIDLSQAMVRDARRSLAPLFPDIQWGVADIRHLPFAEAFFDAVIANNMLYHVKPGRSVALEEIRRVLKPGGSFYAGAHGLGHFQALTELVRDFRNRRFWSRCLRRRQPKLSSNGFHLDNGREQLEPWFASVQLVRNAGTLVVPSAEPLVAYVRTRERFTPDELVKFTDFVRARIAKDGPIQVSWEVGLFIARRGVE
jgi:SAM-dependent methyltransferase